MTHDHVWDLIVVGGGPAGMMAAGRAAEGGAQVLLLEKNDTLGKKLLITGGGRCNVTNAELDIRKLLTKFKDSDKFLFSAFSQFSVQEALEFFNLRNMPTKVEAEQRVFPVSDKAQSVWDVLVTYLKQGKVEIRSNSAVAGFVAVDKVLTAVKLKNGQEIKARSFILATGGTSRPETGSTGDGYAWLKALGHTVVEPEPSLVPLNIKEVWVRRLQGVSLPEVKITLIQNEAKQDSRKGKILFTHFGVSGPTILNMSKDIRELLKYGGVQIVLDVVPDFDHGALNTKLQDIFKQASNKKFKNSLNELLPSALASIIVELSGINPDTPCHSITREERLKLLELLKNITMTVKSLLGEKKAIITSGGVVLEEIDFKTMRSRLVSNLYVIGDMLNIDRPSGGYSLQLCWTTGFVAGQAVAQTL